MFRHSFTVNKAMYVTALKKILSAVTDYSQVTVCLAEINIFKYITDEILWL